MFDAMWLYPKSRGGKKKLNNVLGAHTRLLQPGDRSRIFTVPRGLYTCGFFTKRNYGRRKALKHPSPRAPRAIGKWTLAPAL